ncbi:MAG: CatB-related O-acetyltransferase [Muribaculaceae bacterium]|nr:CatB-related O-acetyltransferase [Muribaculaceae bacterium]
MILRILLLPFRLAIKKYNLYKKEQRAAEIQKKYGNLTKHSIDNPNITVGDFTYGIPIVTLYTGKPYHINIGNFCSISNNVEIIIGGQHRYENISSYSFIPQVESIFYPTKSCDKPVRNINIGNDVWIGKNVTILQGVNIGDGAVIGTNAVIAKDIPPYAIVIGNPARIIKYRFTKDQIESLLRIRWWNWSLDELKHRMNEIMSNDIDGFIKKYDSSRVVQTQDNKEFVN